MDPETHVIESQIEMAEGYPFVYDMSYDYDTETYERTVLSNVGTLPLRNSCSTTVTAATKSRACMITSHSRSVT